MEIRHSGWLMRPNKLRKPAVASMLLLLATMAIAQGGQPASTQPFKRYSLDEIESGQSQPSSEEEPYWKKLLAEAEQTMPSDEGAPLGEVGQEQRRSHPWSPHGLRLRTRIPQKLLPATQLSKDCGRGDWIIYGFHPSWASSTAYLSYQFDLLTHVAFFGYQMNVQTGGPLKPGDLGNWATTPLVDSAHAHGCKVHLTVETIFSNGSSYSMLTNPTVAAAAIDSICYYVRMRKADGVCVDFEDMYSESDAIPFLNWMTSLKAALKKDNPEAELTVAGPALPGTTTFTQTALYQVIDYNVIMGYGYAGNYSGSAAPGCNTPLPPPNGGGGIDMVYTIKQYTGKGVPAKQLVYALPYYGGAWKTQDSTANTPPGTYSSTPTFASVCGNYPSNGYVRAWDNKSQSSYFVKPYDDAYLQAWVLDSASMALRLDTIMAMGLAGTGMWALSYDAGSNQLWDLLNAKFGACATTTESPSFSWDPDWHRRRPWILPLGASIALLILALVVWLDRKARAEILNKYWLYPLGTFLLMSVLVLLLEATRSFFRSISVTFSWHLLIGSLILVVGFLAGRWWTRRKNTQH